ncbi:MAG: hypothetical protein Q7S35_13495 [Candidatus Limnocylindrales bacterium]|nr:hypothetical protein [Candidatus Limnocylindrales bacterium]
MKARPDVSSRDSAESETPPSPRPVELALARAHLRLGSLVLARAELEVLAGEGGLDMPGHVDLAEVRWRTGDLSGAGEAASIALGAGEDEPVALAIAAEAAAALGRPNEARRLATRAMERVAGPIDALFAGMPRSGVWPADAAEPPPTAGTLFHHEPAPSLNRRAGDTDPEVAAARTSAAEVPAGPTTGAPLTLGFWDAEGESDDGATELPDPAGELDAARVALIAGSLDEATLRFALVLRLAPALAPAILEATDGVSGPTINVVRGDAYRLVGLEMEARRAYAAAAWSGSHDRRRREDRMRPTGEPPDAGSRATKNKTKNKMPATPRPDRLS